MRIALAAAPVADCDVTANLAQMKRFMQAAQARGADLVCFGESFLQGFNSLCWRFEEDKDMAITTDGEVFRSILEQSEAIGIDVLFGFIEREGDRLYSSCALIAQGRLLHLYRRISRGWKVYWETDEHYCEGDTVAAFEYQGKTCLIALCGDLWDFPERFAQQQDLLLWPVYISYSQEEWSGGEAEEYAKQAAKTGGDVLMCNPIGLTEKDAFGGCCHFSGGRMLEELAMMREELLIVDV